MPFRLQKERMNRLGICLGQGKELKQLFAYFLAETGSLGMKGSSQQKGVG
jgi:hypothetical protein